MSEITGAAVACGLSHTCRRLSEYSRGTRLLAALWRNDAAVAP